MGDLAPTNRKRLSLRRWLRFSIRSLLLFMLLACALLAWLGKHIVRARQQRPVVAQIEAAGGSAYYDYQVLPGQIDWTKPAPGSKIVRAVLGDDIYATVQAVWLMDPKTTDADVARLHELRGLLSVSFYGSGITDACVDDLLKIKRLRDLHISDTSIRPAGLKRLSRSPMLQYLTLSGASATDAHVRQLAAGFPKLKFLQVMQSSVTDDGIRSLAGLYQLRQLDVFRAPSVTDGGFAFLSALRDLEVLRLVQTSITDDSLQTIGTMRGLKMLTLDEHPITDAGVQQLATLRMLESLRLSGTQIADEGLAVVKEMPELKELMLAGTSITDDGLAHLTGLRKLETLHIGRTAVTDNGLRQLHSMNSLKHLDLGVGDSITMEGVENLKAALPDCVVRCWVFQPDGTGYLQATR